MERIGKKRKDLHGYENEDVTFRVGIRESVIYFVDNIKQQEDALIEIPRAKISLDILKDNTEENTLFTMELTDFKNKKT